MFDYNLILSLQYGQTDQAVRQAGIYNGVLFAVTVTRQGRSIIELRNLDSTLKLPHSLVKVGINSVVKDAMLFAHGDNLFVIATTQSNTVEI